MQPDESRFWQTIVFAQLLCLQILAKTNSRIQLLNELSNDLNIQQRTICKLIMKYF